MSKRLAALSAIGSVFFYAGCAGPPPLTEQRPSNQVTDYQAGLSAPIIVVGRLARDLPVDNKIRPSKWGGGLAVMLFRATVQIDNIVRGDLRPGTLDVYYFRYNFVSGPPRVGNWRMGDRNLFFLRKESGVLRTICDGWSTCVVPVYTGSHPGFLPDPSKPIADAIVDLLLTRGQNCSERQMIEAIVRTKADLFSRSYTIQKLRYLASTESAPVQQAACQYLTDIRQSCE